MYRQQRSGGLSTIFVVALLGIIAGAVYVFMDRQPADTATIVEITATLEPLEPVAIAASSSDILPVNDVPAMQEVTYGARFLAPTAGINSQIVESYLNGTSWEVGDLGAQVGHLQGTGWTHTPGNIVLAGHVEMADGRPGVFANISQMNIGDPLVIMQDGAEHTYRITQMFHTAPDDLSVVYPTTSQRLTLVTCSNYSFLDDEYRDRFIVIAERIR